MGLFILMVKKQITVIPTQLFEAIFLFALCAFFLYRIWHKKSYNLFLYMIVYGVWRFLIEYARDDYRGTTVVSFLTPSQFTAVLMVIGGVIVMIYIINEKSIFYVTKKITNKVILIFNILISKYPFLLNLKTY